MIVQLAVRVPLVEDNLLQRLSSQSGRLLGQLEQVWAPVW